MLEIKSQKIRNTKIAVPGSKSYTHRFLIAAALSNGICNIRNGLYSEDTRFTLSALKQMGARINISEDRFVVHGINGRPMPCGDPIYLGNSGTSMRLLTAVAALGQGSYTLTGTERMGERPIQDLIDGLRQIGVRARSINSNGCPPVEIIGGAITGGSIALRCKISSQFLSALLLVSPFTESGLEINVIEGPVSRPYVDMTIDVMKRFGTEVQRDGYDRFRISGGQSYQPGSYMIEPDCSQAGYFWAAAAITGAQIKVSGTSYSSRQGDVRFVEILEAMGCEISHQSDGIEVAGGELSAVTADMADMPDMVPTLAVVAAFAKGTTVIENVAHLKAKESDRLGVVVQELSKMGIEASCTETGMQITGGNPGAAQIDTHEDHRIAMSFALAGLKVPGIFIKNEKCVEKSFPDYWKVFGKLY